MNVYDAYYRLHFIVNIDKNATFQRKLEIFVWLKDEDDHGDSDAPAGPSARGHPGHEGEHGPVTDPDGWWRQRSWWRGSPGPSTPYIGPAEQRDEDAAFARMRAILEAEDRQRDSEEDYASAKEDQSSSSFDEGDSGRSTPPRVRVVKSRETCRRCFFTCKT
jgi:hypothetical protein